MRAVTGASVVALARARARRRSRGARNAEVRALTCSTRCADTGGRGIEWCDEAAERRVVAIVPDGVFRDKTHRSLKECSWSRHIVPWTIERSSSVLCTGLASAISGADTRRLLLPL
jgi:hypothetical protein